MGAEWLSAESCAELLDLRTRDGKPNRRAFLERFAVRGSFPKPAAIGGIKRWERAAVLRWMADEAKLAAKRRLAA